MTTLKESMKELVFSGRKMAIYSALLTLFLAAYFIVWHYSAISLASGFSVFEISAGFKKIVVSYAMASLVGSSLISLIMLALKQGRSRKIFMWIVLAVFFLSEFVRMFDWGALYFGGNHIDNNFWANAFYTDGLVFLVTKESIALYLSVALFFTGMLYLLKGMAAAAPGEDRS